MFNKKWTLKHTGEVKSDELCDKLHISPEISQILKNRGINEEKNGEIFMNPSLNYLRDPFLLKDMKKSVERIKMAIKNNEKIWIYGDYDVDGVSSTSILCIYFNSINYPVNFYIPNRLEEGYGINEEAIKVIYDQGCDVLISVDCGITSVKEVEAANKLDIDVIITDHHECQSEIPNAFAVINPKQDDCNYPFDMLCGCGVAFKLIQALTPEDVFKDSMNNYLEIVTLATICDIVPLIDENRIIVKNGLRLMREGKNLGLRELIKVCKVDTEKIGSSHIGFSIGPRINASGRLGYSYLGVELFTTNSCEEAKEIAELLEEKNNERQEIEATMYQQAEEIIQNNDRYSSDKVLIIANEGWQHGVIGIVASKLTEKYYKPTILLTIEDGEATGSARSIKGFSIFDALVKCKNILNKFGGHEQAAGLALDANNIDLLREEVNKFAEYNLDEEDLVENINVEFELDEKSISLDLIDELHKLEPYGLANPNPRFIIRDAVLTSMRKIGKNQNHLKFDIKKNDQYECIGFNMAYVMDDFELGDKVDLLFQVDENNFLGKKKVQFLLKDMRLSYPKNTYNDRLSIKLYEKIIPNDLENTYTINCDDNIDDNIHIGEKNIDILKNIDNNTLILANTINGFYKAISDISLLDVDYSVNYNKNERNINKVELIFSPNIDKIDLKRYNSIILYDYLRNKGEYSCLYKNKKPEANIVKHYSDSDLLHLKSMMRDLVPTREEFVNFYKIILKNNEISADFKDIKSVFNLMPLKVFSIIKIFKELSLLDFRLDNENEKISICMLPKPSKKLDLNESNILINLNELNKKLNESF